MFYIMWRLLNIVSIWNIEETLLLHEVEVCKSQKAEPILPCKAGKEYSLLLHSVLTCYRPCNDRNLFYRPGGGGGQKKLFPEVEMQYLLTLQVSIYCMLALQSKVPPFSLHNSQLHLWRVGGRGGGGVKYACVLT